MRYLIVGGGGGGGKGTSPWIGSGIGGAGGGGGGIAYGEAQIGGYSYAVGSGGAGATSDGNRGVYGGDSVIASGDLYSTQWVRANGGQGGGFELLYGAGGTTSNTLTNKLSGGTISGRPGGVRRASGSIRDIPSLTTDQTLGLGDLIDGGKGNEWRNLLLNSQDYFGAIYEPDLPDDIDGVTGPDLKGPMPAPGGAGVDVDGGPGGGGASLGRGGTYKSNKTWTTPGIGGGGGGGGQPTKGINGQDGGNGRIYIFW